MFIVWYGNGKREFLVQTDNVTEVTAEAEKRGYTVKEIISR